MTEPHRYLGTVVEFKSQRGFGHIEREGDVPDGQKEFPKKVFVQWKEIQTDDRWPSLTNGMKVEFSVSSTDRGWKATNITQPGGDKIVIDRDAGIEKVDGEHTGTVKFFHNRRGFGYIELDKAIDGVELKDNRVHVSRSEIVSDDEPPALKVGSKVKFTIVKNDKGYNARDVTQENGDKISYPKSDRPQEPGMQRRGGWGMGGPRGWNTTNVGRGGWGGRQMGGWKRQRGWGDGGGYGGPGGFKRQRRNWNPNFTPDENGNVEVGLFIQKWIVGGIVGKRGETIKKMCKDTGAKMQFGEDNIYLDGEVHRVLALSGNKDEVSAACVLVANKIGDSAQSLNRKLLFLVPEQYCGMLIGKKGATIKKIQGEGGDEKVRADVSPAAIQLPGAHRVNIASIYGGVKNVERAIKEIVKHLGHISQRIQAESRW